MLITEFAKRCAANSGRTATMEKENIDVFLKTLMETIIEEGGMRFSNFGTFTVVDVPEREGVMGSTGKKWVSPAHKVLRFKPSKTFNRMLNGGEEPE